MSKVINTSMRRVAFLLLVLFSNAEAVGTVPVCIVSRNQTKFGRQYLDFSKHPAAYLVVDKFRLDKNTPIKILKKRFARHYQEATRGTDIDVWTILFLDTFPKSKHQWMLYFDANSQMLKKVAYIKI